MVKLVFVGDGEIGNTVYVVEAEDELAALKKFYKFLYHEYFSTSLDQEPLKNVTKQGVIDILVNLGAQTGCEYYLLAILNCNTNEFIYQADTSSFNMDLCCGVVRLDI